MSETPTPQHLLAQLAREQHRAKAQRECIADLGALVATAQEDAAKARQAAEEAIAQTRAAEVFAEDHCAAGAKSLTRALLAETERDDLRELIAMLEASSATLRGVVEELTRQVAERDGVIAQLRREAADAQGRHVRAAEKEAERFRSPSWLAWLLS
jgi:hypothetical protein